MWSSTICKKSFSEGIIKDFTSCQQVMQRKVEETSLFQFCKRYVNFWVYSDRIKLNLLSFWFYSLIFFYKFKKRLIMHHQHCLTMRIWKWFLNVVVWKPRDELNISKWNMEFFLFLFLSRHVIMKASFSVLTTKFDFYHTYHQLR